MAVACFLDVFFPFRFGASFSEDDESGSAYVGAVEVAADAAWRVDRRVAAMVEWGASREMRGGRSCVEVLSENWLAVSQRLQ